jgi:hypothetical protein
MSDESTDDTRTRIDVRRVDFGDEISLQISDETGDLTLSWDDDKSMDLSRDEFCELATMIRTFDELGLKRFDSSHYEISACSLTATILVTTTNYTFIRLEYDTWLRVTTFIEAYLCE